MGAVSSAFVLAKFFAVHILSFRFTNENPKPFEMASRTMLVHKSKFAKFGRKFVLELL